ncbi:MAG: chromosomal replication initiator protein DnaA [Oscillospiraceae bacterium]|nr:chromosomal replication initiator protein DnaA [Oscillospiraceae bacterium]
MNSTDDVWNKVLSILSNDLTEAAINTWFFDCSPVKLANNRFILHTPSTFRKSIIEEQYLGILKRAIGELFSGDFEVIILDDDGLKAMNEDVDDSDYSHIEEFTFENFVVGNSNKFAHAAALAVGEGRQKQGYNPLFIYGESGLGKTHLLHAIRHSIAIKFPHYKIVYVKGEEFLNELIVAIQKSRMVEFREKYRGADFFLIDDIQIIGGKIETQQEFFNTFNALYESGKQIVFTSDRPPSEIRLLEDRLKTRFESSLSADIQPPDDALRVAIIKNKAEQLGFIMPDDVTNYIAENLNSNVRQLEGAVKMIVAYRDIMDENITVASVTQRLKDMFKGSKDTLPTTDTIIEETARYYSLTPDDLKSQSRTRDTALARQIAMYLIRKLTNLSLKETGVIFGRDHTTVINSERKIISLLRETPTSGATDYSSIMKDITSNINSKS